MRRLHRFPFWRAVPLPCWRPSERYAVLRGITRHWQRAAGTALRLYPDYLPANGGLSKKISRHFRKRLNDLPHWR